MRWIFYYQNKSASLKLYEEKSWQFWRLFLFAFTRIYYFKRIDFPWKLVDAWDFMYNPEMYNYLSIYRCGRQSILMPKANFLPSIFTVSFSAS